MKSSSVESFKSLLFLVMLIALQVGLLIWTFRLGTRMQTKETVTVCDTVTYVDTVKYYQPIPKDSVVLCYRTVRLPAVSVDTVGATVRDTVSVILPVTQKMYQDSAYTAWVSGYDVSLDSLKLAMRHDVVTVTKYKSPSRWNLGVSAGCGITPKGAQPFIGIGISYSLVNF